MHSMKMIAGMCALLGVVMVLVSKWQGDALSIEAWGFFGVIQALVYIGSCIEERRR